MITFIIFVIWMAYGFRVIRQHPGTALFISMVSEQTPWKALVVASAMAAVWPFFKFMK